MRSCPTNRKQKKLQKTRKNYEKKKKDLNF